MQIILSRKGFDSSLGRVPSPIFPSGELCSLPIPESISNDHSTLYKEIKAGELSLGSLVNDLTRGKIKGDDGAHLDPDLNSDSLYRLPGWKPLFGQAGAAESHLRNKGVKEGDVFVFYGWFRQVEQVAGIYRYVKDAPDLHLIFGWLQIEQRISVENREEIPLWALDHPHCKRTRYSKIDSIYISSEQMNLPGAVINKHGAGVFQRFAPALCLTAPGKLRSTWRLPPWFYPHNEKSPLSYHARLSRWQRVEDHVLLDSVGRGQEFVLDCEQYPESIKWLADILNLYG